MIIINETFFSLETVTAVLLFLEYKVSHEDLSTASSLEIIKIVKFSLFYETRWATQTTNISRLRQISRFGKKVDKK